MRLLPWSFLSLGFAAILSGGPLACSAPSGSSELRITLGQPTAAKGTAVVALLKQDYRERYYTYCTGVLISERQVLTAAHCSVDHDGLAVQAESVRVAAGVSTPDAEGTPLSAVASLAVHPDFDAHQLLPDQDGLIRPAAPHDLAVWTLAEAPGEAATVPLLASEAVPLVLTAERPLKLSGFGASSSWEGMSSALLRSAVTRYQPQVELSVIKQVVVNGRPVKKTFTYEVAARGPYEFYAGAQNLPDTCKGDSGGPVFYEADSGQALLVGLTSRGDRACTRGGVYTIVSSYIDWLQQQVPGLVPVQPAI